MRKFWLGFGLVLASIALGSAVRVYDKISTGRRSIFTQPKAFPKYKTPLHKALFTQRGYIQFLRWELPVPDIHEFTFCLWVKSTNLTYSHSIFSYSKNENQRLVSSWISPYGQSIHLEIGGVEIMAHPTRLEEHRWYHICESWENRISRFALWINGQKEIEGYANQLIGHVIPSKGDIVVGQEYTDFDKGFEEGIEGAVLGFNLLLVSAFDRSKNDFLQVRQNEANLLSILSLGENRLPAGYPLNDGIRLSSHSALGDETYSGIQLRRVNENPVELLPYPVTNHGKRILNERREGIFDSALNEYLGDDELFDRNLEGSSNTQRAFAVKFVHRNKRTARNTKRIQRGGGTIPLGLQLIDLSYNHCEIGRGSPFVGGSRMLISWTRTPVKVFGGAILKDAKSTCGNF